MTKGRIAWAAHTGLALVVFLLAWLHARFIGFYVLADGARLAWLVVFIVAVVAALYGFGFPDEAPARLRARLGLAVVAVSSGAAGFSLVQLAVGSALLPRFVVFWAALFAIPWYALSAAVVRDTADLRGRATRVLTVVTSREYEQMSAELQERPERAAELITNLNPRELHVEEGAALFGLHSADVLVLNRAGLADPEVVRFATQMHASGMRVRSLSLFYEEWLGKLPVWELEPTSLMFDISEVHRELYGRQKRILDVFVALILVVASLFLAVLIVPLNLLTSRGPLFFGQDRVGRHGRAFTMYKFRTMAASVGNSEWTAHSDARISPVGRVLRAAHLDEVPQAWNILKGDLSLVGPRPEQPHYVDQLREVLPFYDVRHIVRPGITGWAQVKMDYGSSVEEAREKLQYDFFYLRRQSLSLDLQVAFRTIRSVVLRRGR